MSEAGSGTEVGLHSGTSWIRGAKFHRRSLHTNGKAVPVFVAQAAPSDVVEGAGKSQGARGATRSEQLILGNAIHRDNLLVGRSTTPITACIAVDSADTQDVSPDRA